MIQKLLFVLVLVLCCDFSLQSCNEGCLKCQGNNICSVCDALSLYVLINGECIKQDLQFCMFALNLNSCMRCYPGFYLEISGKCVKNPVGVNEIKHCKEYSTYTRCKICEQYYYMEEEGRKCTRITGDPIKHCEVYESNDLCKICGDFIISSDQTRCSEPIVPDNKCMFYSDKTICGECQDTHYLDKNYYLHHIERFYNKLVSKTVDYFFDQDSLINIPVCEAKTFITNCLVPLGNHKCAECKPGYFINENFNECIEDPEATFFFRSNNIHDCYLHNRTMIERNNEQVENVECILCYEGYYKSVNNRKCQKHSQTINNCGVMSQSVENLCLICQNGYYRENGPNNQQCKQRVDVNENCKKYNMLSQECEECIETTYVKHYNNIYCSPKIENCKIHNTTGIILSCQQCNFGYYFSVSNAQCVKTDIFDPYCTFFNENQECQECSFGFYFDETASPAKCLPNSPEYVAKAKCDNFNRLEKGKCIGCDGNKKLIRVLNTCKLFPNNIYSDSQKKAQISYCNKYSLAMTGMFSCEEPTDEVLNDDESQKKVYILYTDQEKAHDVTSSRIQYCNKHKTIYKNASEPLLCDECYKTRFITTYFEYSNVKDLSNCKEDETDSGYCVRFFSEYNKCRHYNWSNINTHNCPNGYKGCYENFWGDTICEHDKTCKYCRWKCDYNSQWSLNNCAGQNWKDEECASKDEFGNCLVFYFFQDNMAVNFYEDIKYEIVLSPDKKRCLMYDQRYIENNSFCVKLTDDSKSCILCKKGFYSVPIKTFTYELDSIESYVAKINVEGFVDKCIKFNQINGQCTLCAPGYYLQRNTCVNCQTTNVAIDYTNLTCIQYVDETFQDTCKRTALLGTTTYCVECKSGYVSQINWDKTISPEILYYPILDGEQTMIQLVSEISSLKKCIDFNDLFYIQEDYYDTLKNCLFYQISDTITYCLGCKFGFTGIVHKTLNGFLTVQNCTVDENCDLSQTYPLDDPYISSLVTCHKCTDSSKIPTYYFFYTTAVGVNEPSFIYEPSHSDKKTMKCTDRGISNCLIQFETNDPIVQQRWGNRSKVCVYCEPKYHPTYEDTGNDYFPYKIITSCSYITDCEKSLIPNICESCQSSGQLPKYNTKGIFPNSGTNACQTNSYIQQDPFCKRTTSTYSSGICDECKDGYVYLNLKCIPLNITSCKYFRGSTCVESTKELDENKSIIWRQYNSDYTVEQVNCVEVQTAIDNCAYYTAEDICYQCDENYFLTNDGKYCFMKNVDNCVEYNNDNGTCIKCGNNYYAQNGICIPSGDGTDRGCSEYTNGFCSKCTEEGFHPVKINTNKTTICINSTITRFCEEVDEEMLLNDKVISCKTCKKIKEYETVDTEDNFFLNNYDFFSVTTNTFADDNGLNAATDIWSYYSSMNSDFVNNVASTQDVRIALFKYNFDICREFITIDNCLKYDTNSFENSFNCIECTANYYLENNVCLARTLEDFCTQYSITENKCLLYVDSSQYSIQYSSFDIFVIDNPPEAKGSATYTDSGIEGCVSYYGTNTCRYCNNTTYLYDNLCLTVENIVPECEIYSRNGLCYKCKGDLLLFQNKCLTKYSKNCQEFLSNTSCKQCTLEYPYIISGSCKKNPDIDKCDKFMNSFSCSKCDTDYFRNQNGKCVLESDYTPNCKHHLSGGFCQECNDGYVLQENSCIYAPTYDPNCKKYLYQSSCNICQFNYYFKSGVCFECDTDAFNCYFCNPDNPSQCILCRPGFFMNEQKECVIVPDYTQPLIKLYQQSVSSKFVSVFLINSLIFLMALLDK